MLSNTIAALCTSLAFAKPQYNYPAPTVPSGSYGAPSGTGFQTGGTITQTSQSGGGFAVAGGFSGEQSFSGTRGIPGKQIAAGIGSGADSGTQLSGGHGGGTLIQKHIYVHVAPPEPEEVRPTRPISAGQSTKHYKIIFIKAPSYQPTQQQILQQQAQNEEKTLVYVLVKKPDEVADITIPTAAPTAPSKPEVYFIRYKAKSEVAGGAAAGGAAAGSQLSGGGNSASLSLSSASSATSQFNAASSLSLSTGDSSSSVSVARPQTSYGPPGQSGPY